MRRIQRSRLRRALAERALPQCVQWVQGQIVRSRDAAAMELVPEGTFLMGDETEQRDEQPMRDVYLSAYLIDKFEVTNRQFKLFVDDHPEWAPGGSHARMSARPHLTYWINGTFPPGQQAHPAHHVCWEAAQAYAQWAGAELPTEAQWEKAARGGLKAKQYPWGDTSGPAMVNWGWPRWPHLAPGQKASPRDIRGAKRDNPGTTPVGSFPPNGYGLHDVAGNVWEWCADWYGERYYRYAPNTDPQGPRQALPFEFLDWGTIYVRSARGGSWYRRPRLCRCANRSFDHFGGPIQGRTDYYYGFRCVVPLLSRD